LKCQKSVTYYLNVPLSRFPQSSRSQRDSFISLHKDEERKENEGIERCWLKDGTDPQQQNRRAFLQKIKKKIV